MHVDMTSVKEGCLWIESHSEKRHMAVSGKVWRGKRGFSEMANDICTCRWNIIQLLCSFVVHELLKSALVLVLVLLLVLVLVLVLFFAVVVVVVVVAAAHLIFACFWALENRQIGSVFAFVDLLEQKTP